VNSSIYVHILFVLVLCTCYKGKNGKAITVTGRRCPQVCETSRLSHFLENRLTDGGEAVSRCWPSFTPQEDSWCIILLQTESTLGS
jgi:hypothetical protein